MKQRLFELVSTDLHEFRLDIDGESLLGNYTREQLYLFCLEHMGDDDLFREYGLHTYLSGKTMKSFWNVLERHKTFEDPAYEPRLV
jgi:hypothetical protein